MPSAAPEKNVVCERTNAPPDASTASVPFGAGVKPPPPQLPQLQRLPLNVGSSKRSASSPASRTAPSPLLLTQVPLAVLHVLKSAAVLCTRFAPAGVLVSGTDVLVGVFIGVIVSGRFMFVGVLVGGTFVGVLVADTAVFVGVLMGVAVDVFVGAFVGKTPVAVGVFVAGTMVFVGVSVGVLVAVSL